METVAMTKQELRIEEVKNQQDLMTFVRFPGRFIKEIDIGSHLSSKTSF